MHTTRQQFNELLAKHRIVPVVRELFADFETPVGLYYRLAHGRSGSFLLESAVAGVWSQYSFIGVHSFGILSTAGDKPRWISANLSESEAFGPVALAELKPMQAITALYNNWRSPRIPELPPLTGGLVGFLGWESIRQLEHISDAQRVDYNLPTQSFAFVSDLVVVNHKTGTVSLIANALKLADKSDDDLWQQANHRLDALEQMLLTPSQVVVQRYDVSAEPTPIQTQTKAEFIANVEKTKEYIRIGDAFQVVPSQRFDHTLTADSLDVYRALRVLNPSPYMYILNLEDERGEAFQIVGSSPEALIKIQNNTVVSHPIAGSRPRGATPEADAELAESLLADDKEKAEHLMLVDLVRNDLLKVCEPASVKVTEFMQIERFSHIMHLSSSVTGTLRSDSDPIQALAATFPAGTLSGAPKPRALEIITELEPYTRNVYGGVVGYLNFSGDADLAIAIRTATLHQGIATVQAGAGIVADSVPELEYQESVNKAAAPLRAVAIANTMRPVRCSE